MAERHNELDFGAWTRDLGPEFGAFEPQAAPAERARTVSAEEVEELQTALPEFTNAELSAIAVVPPAAPLTQGATYLDVGQAIRREFTAGPGQAVPAGHWCVAKSRTDHELWNRLRGVSDPVRSGLP